LSSVGGVNVRPSQIILLLAIAAALRWLAQAPEKTPFRWPEWLWLAAFLGFNVLSLLNAENLPRSLIVLGFTVFTASLAVILPLSLRAPEDFSRARRVILLSAAAVGLFGLWQFAGDMLGAPTALTGLRPQYAKAILGFTRVQSTALEPLYFADYLLLPIGLALSWIVGGAKKYRGPLLALLGLLFVNLVLTSSRGGYAGFIALCSALAWMHRRRLRELKKFLPLVLAAAALVIVTIAAIGRFNVTTPDPLSSAFIRHVVTITDGAAFVERSETIGKAFEAFAPVDRRRRRRLRAVFRDVCDHQARSRLGHRQQRNPGTAGRSRHTRAGRVHHVHRRGPPRRRRGATGVRPL